MKEQINIKRVLIYTVLGAILLSGLYLFIDPQPAQKENKLEQFLKNINEKQNIAPKRLYVNAWRKIKNEYLDTSMNGQDWYKWRYRYLKEIETLEDADVAINTMIASLNDTYSAFLRTEMYKKQKVVMEANVTGIGANVKKSAQGVAVDNIVLNSPADQSSMVSGDVIIKVNDVDVKNINLSDISNIFSAASGKMVRVQIKRDGKIIEKDIMVKNFDIKNMLHLITDDNIGYIRIENFMGNFSVNEFKSILGKTNKTKGIIIDLRNNYGGILTNAINMADLMISDDIIVSLKSRGGYIFKIYAKPTVAFSKKPVVILTNNSTASSAEILAGALRDDIGAIIIGEQTFGKNTLQKIIPLQNMTGLVLTNGKYILPKGEDIHDTGIIPDIFVANFDTKRDAQLDTAFEVITILSEHPEKFNDYTNSFNNYLLKDMFHKKTKLINTYKVKHSKLI